MAMSERDKKMLVVLVPLLVVAAVLLYFFVFRGTKQPGPTAETTGAETSAGAPVQPTPTGAETGAITPGVTGATGGTEVAAAANWSGKPSELPGRSNPFGTYTTIKVEPIKTDHGTGILRTPVFVPPVGAKQVQIPPPGEIEQIARRMAGVLHNGRVWAIYEREGVSYIVKPGDPVGAEIITAIAPDHLVLRDPDGHERSVPLERISGYEATSGTGISPYPTGIPGPPAPPRPPAL
jgi:hypothetical protein